MMVDFLAVHWGESPQTPRVIKNMSLSPPVAILEGEEDRFVRIHVKKGTDQIVGATIVARNAGGMISEITLAMTHRLGLSKIGATIHSYPTQAEAIRKLGD